MKHAISESDLEKRVLSILYDIGYEIIYGDKEEYLPGGLFALRSSYKDVLLIDRLKNSLQKINPAATSETIEQAIKQLTTSESQLLLYENERFHKMLVDGIDIAVRKDNEERYEKIYLFDFHNPANNDFMATNQFTVVENNIERRPDVVLFINGIPLVIMELKNPASENATILDAYNQLQTYKEQIPSIFTYNEVLVITDGYHARTGTITSKVERFMQWKTIDGEKIEDNQIEIDVLLRGMFDKNRLLDIVRNFIVFEKNRETHKKLAAYHQYWAVNKAVASTIRARAELKMIVKEKPENYNLPSVRTQPSGDKKAGVVWHTQGSGKSLTMVFYAGKIIRELDNPTIVVLTDRNDLDDQLFNTFSHCQDILRQAPVQANSRKELQELLRVASGGVVFTTIQKFFSEEEREKYPLLSDRHNIIVIADEAHRTQYGFAAKIINKNDKSLITYGYAKYLRDALPNASFIGFTGTPIEKADKSTPAVFGNYIDVYDIEQAVEDGATVRIYYESRLAKLDLKPEERPKIDKEFEELTEGQEVEGKEKLKSKWASLEKLAGAPERIKRIAKDIVEHFENRLSVLDGKGMIVCMSRRICVELYNELVALKPHWHSDDDDRGFIKVVMTGSASDPVEWQKHIRNKERRKRIGENFKDPAHELKLIIVRDMFLTGFDVPCLHTMYLDKPMQGHNLMQAIARVNRVYPGKEGGLVVDYMGIGAELKQALSDYTESGGRGKPVFNQEEAVALMLEKYEVVRDMFHGFDYSKFFVLKPEERITFLPDAMEHILKEKDKKEKFIRETTALIKAFSLSLPHEEAMKIKEEVGFFQAVKSSLTKLTDTKKIIDAPFESAIKQIISKAVISDRVIDIFEAAGIKKPDISILSDAFLAEIKEMPHKNLALEALKKLLNDEIKIILKRNLVQGRSFLKMLEETIKKYTNRSVEAAEVIEELIELAKQVREDKNRGVKLNLSEDELAFYDALGVNDSAVKVLGDETLRKIALELTQTIRKSVTIDWTRKESARAEIRLKVKKILRKYGYPPDREKTATETVLEQAALVASHVIS
ncbi:type I restriction endonuclease subunit R [Melioribacter sp. OK-6-Me]|uniref:type I restriction endonuclease subunit R n=1 Tax=unclassified Melioribacter TaxID=2627329 RepID=UPI003EDB5AB7